KEEELQLFHEYRTTGNREAAVKLILSNLRISVAIAAEYLHSGPDYMDLIQEGNVGLMQAIRKFDTTKGVRFHSYAARWVRADEELRELFRRKLAEFAATLDDRYADILRNRILSENPMTLDDIGKKYNISRERARQLEEKIIKRLREYLKKEIKDFELLKP